MTTKRQYDNTAAWLEEWKQYKPGTNIVAPSGKVGVGSPCKEGQIRSVGEGRILLMKSSGSDFLICQISDFENPAAESEIKLKTSGKVLQIWGAFRAPSEILKTYPIAGTLSKDDIEEAVEFWAKYYAMQSCPNLQDRTGAGSVYDTDEGVAYMDKSTAEITDLIVRVFQ